MTCTWVRGHVKRSGCGLASSEVGTGAAPLSCEDFVGGRAEPAGFGADAALRA
jgi:hypothetical protein